MLSSISRIIIAALKGGSGKTIFSLGLISAWRNRGYRVAPFKKGPDFIDAGWLTFAAGRACYNLDPFLMSERQILDSFRNHSADSDISLIEGNRGLYDGLDLNGCCSTAELGKLTGSPVILIVDVTMATRTMAALVMGCQNFDPDLNIAAVILNRVAGPRQERLVRDSIEQYCGIPVIGSVPKLRENPFPQRHMGLVPYQEREHAERAVKWARTVIEEHIDLEKVWKLSRNPEPAREKGTVQWGLPFQQKVPDPPRIGYVNDSSFWFYYPENLDLLRSLGANLFGVNSITDSRLPDLDALYIGGGFPETRAKELAENRVFRESLREAIEGGMPVYAECGGLIYLGEELEVNGERYPMVGALPIRFVMDKKPQGHGYTILRVDGENPYYPKGEIIKGHEFHYSKPVVESPGAIHAVLKVERGHGLDGESDGLIKKNLFATYTHIHAGGNRLWGEGFFRAAAEYRRLVKKDTKIGIK